MTKRKEKRIRLYAIYGLILFVSTGFCGCFSPATNDQLRLRWNGKTAEGVDIPQALTGSLPSDSVAEWLRVRRIGSDTTVSLLGDYQVGPQTISFTPLIPFTRGLRYEVVLKDVSIGTFDIPLADPADAPRLLGMYPSQDTLPENLLKMYLHFSQPMQEGKSEEYIFLVRNQTDTVKGAFLNLQPELWNEDRTVLTLWLDPGRIKRDLHPNRQLGSPLQKDGRYQVRISPQWKDQQGRPLPEIYTKSFVVTGRDSLSPVPANWKIVPPAGGTTQALRVEFKEPLDYSLIIGSLSILDENGNMIAGTWEAGGEEKTGYFKPSGHWKAGSYVLSARTVLEDLAGNNLNRPFDRDLTKEQTRVPSGDFVEVSFIVDR